jgi:hypothetical protein
MKRVYYYDTVIECYDCKLDGHKTFATWTDDREWMFHTGASTDIFTLGDVQVPDTCLILNHIPVDDENFLR